MNYKEQINDFEPLKSFENLERYLTSQQQFEFFGLPMAQIPSALGIINNLLETIKPTKIIEFGTGMGGLSVLLSLYSSIKGVQFLTYDCSIHRQDILNHLYGKNIFQWEHLDKEYTQHKIEHVIKQNNKGPTILFCDALKYLEFNHFSQFLKPGDFILMHDYAREENDEKFKQISQKYGWTGPQEQWYDKIKDSCEKYNIIPFMPDKFEETIWFCGIKK